MKSTLGRVALLLPDAAAFAHCYRKTFELLVSRAYNVCNYSFHKTRYPVMQMSQKSIFFLCVLALLAPSSSHLFGQTEQGNDFDFIPFNTATQQSVATGQPLMVLGFSEG